MLLGQQQQTAPHTSAALTVALGHMLPARLGALLNASLGVAYAPPNCSRKDGQHSRIRARGGRGAHSHRTRQRRTRHGWRGCCSSPMMAHAKQRAPVPHTAT